MSCLFGKSLHLAASTSEYEEAVRQIRLVIATQSIDSPQGSFNLPDSPKVGATRPQQSIAVNEQ